MKNRILIISVLILPTGCASLKYPNWESVKIENCVHNMPCASKGVEEKCNQLYGCDVWFKKRATLVDANTAVIDKYTSTATYFQCETGQPIYKEHIDYKFNEEKYKPYLESGTNTVTGQAFLTQSGGDVVTCAGESVLMFPDTEYFNQRDSDISKGCKLTNESNAITDLYKSNQCDAQGNFEFHKVPAGDYVIRVKVSWNVGNEEQGGILRKKVTVRNGEINKFIISR